MELLLYASAAATHFRFRGFDEIEGGGPPLPSPAEPALPEPKLSELPEPKLSELPKPKPSEPKLRKQLPKPANSNYNGTTTVVEL